MPLATYAASAHGISPLCQRTERRSRRHNKPGGKEFTAVNTHTAAIGSTSAARIILNHRPLSHTISNRGGSGTPHTLHHRQSKLFAPPGVAHGTVLAHIHAIEACHATRTVNHMVGHIYALCLAHMLAFTAINAKVGVDIEMKQRIAAENTEGAPNRTNCVADKAPVHVGHGSYCQKCYHGNHECQP
jgi:hypothetical protein